MSDTEIKHVLETDDGTKWINSILVATIERDYKDRIKRLQSKLTARDESLDKANTQIERMRERVKKLEKENSEVRQHAIDCCDFEMASELVHRLNIITPPTDKGER